VGVRAADAMLLYCVLAWSGNFTAVGYGLERFHPLAHASLRFALGGLAFAAIARAREGSLRIERRDWPIVAGLAFVGIVVNQTTVVYAVRDAGPANIAMLMATAPLFAAGLAVALGHERLHRAHWVGISIAIVGVFGVIHGSGAHLGGGTFVGGLIGIAAAASWGGY